MNKPTEINAQTPRNYLGTFRVDQLDWPPSVLCCVCTEFTTAPQPLQKASRPVGTSVFPNPGNLRLTHGALTVEREN